MNFPKGNLMATLKCRQSSLLQAPFWLVTLLLLARLFAQFKFIVSFRCNTISRRNGQLGRISGRIQPESSWAL